MGTIVAAQTGNWSSTSTWTGGVLPAPGDTAQTDSFTVTIDQSITVDVLEPTSSGRFEVSSGGITINADLVMSSSNAGGGLRCTHTTGTVTLNGNVAGGSTNSTAALALVAAGAVVINGNVTGGSGSTAYGVNNASTGAITLNGNATGGSGNGAYGATMSNTAGSLLVTGYAIGNDYGPGGSTTNIAYGVYGNHNAGSSTKVRKTRSGPYGAAAIGGAVLLDDHADNEAEYRLASGGATKTLIDPAAAATDYPAVSNVRAGVQYDFTTKTGTLALPDAGDVRDGEGYGAGGAEYAGTLVVPAESDVEDGVGYGAGGTEFEGNVTLPAVNQVREDVTYGAAGTEFTGTLHIVGSVVEQVIAVDIDDGNHDVLRAFYPGTSKSFSVIISVGGVARDITSDTVTLRLKTHPDDSDASSVITAVADVLSSGASGVALFDLGPDDTNITPRVYDYDVVWETGHDEYVILSGRIQVKDRVSDY